MEEHHLRSSCFSSNLCAAHIVLIYQKEVKYREVLFPRLDRVFRLGTVFKSRYLEGSKQE